jgi:S-adenosylmethionine-diacylglycerol 3-amino-3-carboxypropyl transferase
MEALASFESWPREASRAIVPGRNERVLYGQVWEDADLLLEALDVRPGQVCLSIASAGDNALALLSRAPARLVAIDRDVAQLRCLELRVAAYRTLAHSELLELIGSRPSRGRVALYERCRPLLSRGAQRFWDLRPEAVASGVANAGRFEKYFALFRKWVLPLVHSKATIANLLQARSAAERERFYEEEWNTWRWQLLFHAFFSRRVMRFLGRDRHAFAHVDGQVAAPILQRTRHALTTLNPADNPYVHWILTGQHGDVLPYALREENFDAIRSRLDRLEWRHQSLRGFLAVDRGIRFDRCNLSDVFEYVSPDEYEALLSQLTRVCRPGARLVYWNMLAPRTRPASLAGVLHPAAERAARLHPEDRAFFYSRLVIENVL